MNKKIIEDKTGSHGLSQKQVRKLAKYIIDIVNNKNSGGTYRYLIYQVLGLDFGAVYFNRMERGLLILNNELEPKCLRRCKRRKL